MNIIQALRQLDPDNDGHWTDDGVPLVNVVSEILGKRVSRQEITNADSTYTRESAVEILSSDQPATIALPPEETVNQELDDDEGKEEVVTETEDLASETAEVAEEADVRVIDTIPIGDVLKDAGLCEIALRELEVEHRDSTAKLDLLQARIDMAAQHIQTLSRKLEKMPKPKGDGSDLKRYQRVQQETRERRAAAARKFIEGGTTPKDVLEELDGKSKLDRAMSQRRPALGAGRKVRPQLPTAG